MAAEIEQRLEAQGVRQRFSRPIEAIERAGDGLEVCLGGGERLPCDIALLCIGTRANTQLADAIDTVLSVLNEEQFNALMDQAIAIQPEV